ncbi:periplasmic heavy metal sensor [Sneathiella limimaris]|uniref:periplasmic heavy metal sensor n=1 Tax=Sneathiella limimaris TaxID=1964213 RepID=UPI00146E134C|nr:periplasmic heavy metal sensor [Sneathiella limimaris]
MAKSRIFKIVLIISLLINLMAIGFIGAQWFRHGHHKGGLGGMMFDRRAAMSTLDGSYRSTVHDIWHQRRDKIRGEIRNIIAHNHKLAELLSEDPLDEDAIAREYDNIVQYKRLAENTFFTTLLETAKSLSPDQRKAFFGEGFPRWSRWRHEKEENE